MVECDDDDDDSDDKKAELVCLSFQIRFKYSREEKEEFGGEIAHEDEGKREKSR